MQAKDLSIKVPLQGQIPNTVKEQYMQAKDMVTKVPLVGQVPNTDRVIGLKKADIKRLKRVSLINAQTYLYLAILCSYGDSVTSVDKDWFCEEWDFEGDDFDILAARLQKKGLLSLASERFVQLRLFDGGGDED